MSRNFNLPTVVNHPLCAVEIGTLTARPPCFPRTVTFLRHSVLAQSISLEFVLVFGTRTVRGQRPKCEREYCLH